MRTWKGTTLKNSKNVAILYILKDKYRVVLVGKVLDFDSLPALFDFITSNKIKYYLCFSDNFEFLLKNLSDRAYYYLTKLHIGFFNKDFNKWFFVSRKYLAYVRYKYDKVIEYVKNKYIRIYTQYNVFTIENSFNDFHSYAALKEYLTIEQDIYNELGVKWSLYPSMLYSIGARVSLLLQKMKVKHKLEKVEDIKELLAGRIETSYKGYIDKKVYSYDINSAYLYALSNIPFGIVQKYEGYKQGIGIYKIKFNLLFQYFKLKFFPFAVKQGNITFFPAIGETFITSWELEEYTKLYGFKGIKILQSYIIEEKQYLFKDFANILYEYKNKVNNELANMLKKFGNAIYGKFASKYSSFYNLFYANLITGYIRAMLLPYLLDRKNEVFYCFVDNIMSTKDLHIENKQLGGFKKETFERMYLLGIGKYYAYGQKEKLKTMGLNNVSIQDIKSHIRKWFIKSIVYMQFRSEVKSFEVNLSLIPQNRLVFHMNGVLYPPIIAKSYKNINKFIIKLLSFFERKH